MPRKPRKPTPKKSAKLRRDRIACFGGQPIRVSVGDVYRYRANRPGSHWRYYRVTAVHTPVERTPSVSLRRYTRTGQETSETGEQRLQFDRSRSDHWELGAGWEAVEGFELAERRVTARKRIEEPVRENVLLGHPCSLESGTEIRVGASAA